MLNYLNIRNICKFLDHGTCQILVLSLVISHLDYCNSLLYGLPEITLKKFQRIQNLCARLVLRRSKYSSNRQNLKELHWLPIRQRINFKIVSIVHKCVYGMAHKYLTNMIAFKQSSVRSLRSTAAM